MKSICSAGEQGTDVEDWLIAERELLGEQGRPAFLKVPAFHGQAVGSEETSVDSEAGDPNRAAKGRLPVTVPRVNPLS